MRQLLFSLLLLMTGGCGSFTVRPASPPPATTQAQEINRAQSVNLQRMGTVSVSVRGSPDDALRAIAGKANAAGANWYLVQLVSETAVPGYWYATAVLYGGAVAATSKHP
ncbi:biofilm peroxide resistance protein BsmA [Erwinia psidii]|uniref:Biofilm peroxide resistance protein BsmA n=1 Tax=Erwinia psidii TaxID=69224 RepID=A0A3N6UYY5_9GAMM|nr:biofilm peroxide resistance protein BsmA [Erwinia psidii]MCX8958267.1 biofilm peroxide resistance protein BsmA [Erwinia psidii]MCX8962409.1 biofilm peroxide resistance protein BsmA [Erwinia psidii]MCX8965193.1 biofilm peroxide resistance protein BsmA [Erwinia psidii]RQM38005.1 biofilm peroxide resistance protein BsmA [Erwinia psidii]